MSLVVKIGADIREFDREMRRLTRDVNTIGKKMSDVGKTMTTYVTAPLAGLGAAVAKTGSDFEATMSKVAATMGKPKSEISDLTKLARDMGKTTQFSATEAGDAINYMALAGWDSKSIIEGLPGLLNLAAAGGMDLATAADIVTDGMTGMGLASSETNRIVDMMAKTASSSNTSVEQMGKAMILVAGQSNTLGIAQNDLALSLGLMANAGFKGEIAGQHLSAGIRRIVSPSKKAQKAMDEYGITMMRNKDGSMDLGGTIEQMREKLNGLDKVQKATALSAIFGADAQKSWGGIINASEKDFSKLKDAIANAEGAGAQMSETMGDNLQGRIKIMQSSLQEVAIQLYDALAPALELVVKGVTKFAEAFQNLSPKAMGFLTVLAALLSSIGPLLLAFASIIKMVGFVKAAFTAMGVASMGVVGVWVLVGAAVAALVLAIIFYWDDIKEVTITVWNAIADFMSALWSGIVDVAKAIWGGLSDFFSGLWEGIKSVTESVWNGIKDFFSEWGLTILAVITGPIGMLALTIYKYWDEIKSAAEIAWNAIKEFLVGIWNGIVDTATPIFNAIGEAVSAVWNIISTVTSSVWGFIHQYLTALWTGLLYFVTPILDKISEWFSKTWETIKTVSSTVWNAIKDFLTKVMTDIKNKFTEIWNSIKDFLTKAFKSIETVAHTIFNSIKEFFLKWLGILKDKFTEIWNLIKSTVETIWNTIKTIASNTWNAILNVIMSPINRLRDMATSAFNTMESSVSSIFNSIKSTASSIWNSITSIVTGTVSKLVGGVNGSFEGMKSTVIGIWEGMKAAIKTVINGIISMVNKFIDGFNIPARSLNKIPGVDAPLIPHVPMLATGGTIFGNGQAIVGEAGPELVSKSGSSVKVTPLSAGEKAGGIGGALGVGDGVTINIASMAVRNDSDIQKVSRDLFEQIQRTKKGRGMR